MAELERQRVASAQAARAVRRFESCCLRHRPVAQRQSSGLRTHVRPFDRAGRPCCCAGRRSPSGDRRPRESTTLACKVGVLAAGPRSLNGSITNSCGSPNSMRRRSTVGRPAVTRRMLVRAQPSQPQHHSCPDRLAVEDAGLSHRKRGFDSRSGYFTARPRTRLETRPGCLPGEAGSTPVEGVHLAVAQWASSPRSSDLEVRGFDSSRRDCRRTASSEPPGCDPASRVRFPGDAGIDDGPAGQAPL